MSKLQRINTKKPIMTPPPKITPAFLSVAVMPNGEVICLGKTVGWVTTLGPYLYGDDLR